MTRQYEWESSLQWAGICKCCGDFTWVTTSEVTEEDYCEACFQ